MTRISEKLTHKNMDGLILKCSKCKTNNVVGRSGYEYHCKWVCHSCGGYVCYIDHEYHDSGEFGLGGDWWKGDKLC